MMVLLVTHGEYAHGGPFHYWSRAGELDRIRSGYYPKFFYPKLGKLAENFIPKFEQAYYIHSTMF
jgi:hypothetical protein